MKRTIYVVGLGAGELEQLPLGVYRHIKETEHELYVRTKDHPVVKQLRAEGISFTSFDSIYEAERSFAAVYEQIVTKLVHAAEHKRITYCVPGHPMLAEQTVQMLLQRDDVIVEMIGGQSYLDSLFTALRIDPIEGFQFIDATAFERDMINYQSHVIFCQLYDSFIASEVKLTLLEDLHPNTEVTVVEAAGTTDQKLQTVPLHELDRTVEVSNLTSLYVPPIKRQKLTHQFATLRNVIRTLRGPDGCPWDRKQTHESLRQYAIEEVYELIEAINREDDDAIIEELGDVLLQVMLHSQIGEENGYFTIDDVIRSVTEKMIHRHPHVFSNEGHDKTWDELKREEGRTNNIDSLLHSVVRHGPQLSVAYELQQKAAKVGFDWDDVHDVWEKLDEEIAEFHEAVQLKDELEMEKEFGDMLFVLANIARFYHIHPEVSLSRTNEKFITRFHEVEKAVQKSKRDWSEYSLEELDQFWEEAKRKE
ncbi:MAG TPA: nucleoside triphosphate pyrophosphohydrolase [Pseudogracilibacillus sp.]|nr:nucleoside triphosphate pyrophosphohydrolase [Pseudogracilibacillus sp.]